MCIRAFTSGVWSATELILPTDALDEDSSFRVREHRLLAPLRSGFRRGRNRIDEGVKGVFFPGMVPPLSGYAIVANDNYAPVAQAA